MESNDWKYLIVLGMTGDGKSYLLNTLVGCDPEESNAPFTVGSLTSSCTEFASIKTFSSGLFNDSSIPI
jgi:energy-coupling factor transporter ATP-binding protein EcfA2